MPPLADQQDAVLGIDRDDRHAARVGRDVACRAVAVGRLDGVHAELEDAAAAEDLGRDEPLAQRIVLQRIVLRRIVLRRIVLWHHRLPRIATHDGTARAARVAMSGTIRSGVACAGGVAPEPARPPRRSTQTVDSPSRFAGTWS